MTCLSEVPFASMLYYDQTPNRIEITTPIRNGVLDVDSDKAATCEGITIRHHVDPIPLDHSEKGT
jgi:hypothetical protein